MAKNVIILLLSFSVLALGFIKPKLSNKVEFKSISLIKQIPLFDTLIKDTIITDDTVSQKKTLLYGTASYYHNKFEGRKTASGDVFSQKKLTCAHRTIPLGKHVRVTNLSNNKSIDLLVNDRMGKSRHEIDLSKAAAVELDFVLAGWTKVSIEVLD